MLSLPWKLGKLGRPLEVMLGCLVRTFELLLQSISGNDKSFDSKTCFSSRENVCKSCFHMHVCCVSVTSLILRRRPDRWEPEHDLRPSQDHLQNHDWGLFWNVFLGEEVPRGILQTKSLAPLGSMPAVVRLWEMFRIPAECEDEAGGRGPRGRRGLRGGRDGPGGREDEREGGTAGREAPPPDSLFLICFCSSLGAEQDQCHHFCCGLWRSSDILFGNCHSPAFNTCLPFGTMERKLGLENAGSFTKSLYDHG